MKANIDSDGRIQLIAQTISEASLLQRLNGKVFTLDFQNEAAILRYAISGNECDEYDNNA